VIWPQKRKLAKKKERKKEREKLYQQCSRWAMVGPQGRGSCPLARRVIEHGDWAAKEEVSKNERKRKRTSTVRAGG
jgi:hypothetical protein